MRINPVVVALMTLLSAGPCWAQYDQSCAVMCYDCVSDDPDELCCNGGDTVCCYGESVCDCALGGDYACDPGQICDDGCCVDPPDCGGGQPCDADGNCGGGNCVDGCCTCQTCEEDPDCGQGSYCNAPPYSTQETGPYCCAGCSALIPCGDPTNDYCWCGIAPYSTTQYCNCLLYYLPNHPDTDCTTYNGYGVWLSDYPKTCFGDAPGCPDGVVTCYYGATQCTGTGRGCDSNGCCTLSCTLPSSFYNGQCPVDWTQVGDCCEHDRMCALNAFCNTDQDCAPFVGNGLPYCIAGCCSSCDLSPGTYGLACGNCGWGQWQCDGTCGADGDLPCSCDVNDPNDPNCGCNVGQACGNCGTTNCQGNCDDPCPNTPGTPCGGCGTYESDGSTCDDPCNGCSPYAGNQCGNCGSYECNGSTCDDPCGCDPNMGGDCGGCGRVQCDGSCNDPCNGCYEFQGWSCGNCGVIQCDGSCDDPCACDPNYGNGCGNCGSTNCDGSCNDPCQAVKRK